MKTGKEETGTVTIHCPGFIYYGRGLVRAGKETVR